MERFSNRTQVPESDPAYTKEREHDSNGSDDKAFGEWETETYEFNEKIYARVLENNARFTAELATLDPESPQAAVLIREMRKDTEFAETQHRERADGLRSRFRQLARNLRFLLAQEMNEDREVYILATLRTMFSIPDIQDELRTHFGEDLETFTTAGLIRAIEHNLFSDKFVYIVAKKHVERVNE